MKRFEVVKMDNIKNIKKKKSTYNAIAQKKYNERNKIISCKVDLDFYNKIKTHTEKKGYKSLNSYIIDLIKKDMNI